MHSACFGFEFCAGLVEVELLEAEKEGVAAFYGESLLGKDAEV